MKVLKWLSVFLIGVAIGYTSAPSNNIAVVPPSLEEPAKAQILKDQQVEIETDTQENDKALIADFNMATQSDKIAKGEMVYEVNTKYLQLEDDYLVLQDQLAATQLELEALREELGLSKQSDITDEDLLSLVPEAYAKNLTHYRGVLRDAIYDYHQAPEDLGTGLDISYQIKSYIESHPDSFGVAMDAVTCKETSCELLIRELEQPSWHNIFNDLKTQPWWQFTSTNSSARGDGRQVTYFYYFLSNPTKSS